MKTEIEIRQMMNELGKELNAIADRIDKINTDIGKLTQEKNILITQAKNIEGRIQGMQQVVGRPKPPEKPKAKIPNKKKVGNHKKK